MLLDVKTVSSLEKVFCNPRFEAPVTDRVSGARGETVAFQIALQGDNSDIIDFQVETAPPCPISLREVGLVPCLAPCFPDDPYVITSDPGVFPDPLLPLKDNKLRLTRSNWHAVWVSMAIPADAVPGEYPVTIRVLDRTVTVTLEILPFELPEQTLLSISWFYADCLRTYYKLDAWCERHWELLEAYFKNMMEHGENVIFTPLWTVPLDTAVGHERPITQLLDIEYDANTDKYTFDFGKLERWIRTAQKCGFRYFEMVHAFSQWGAVKTPLIVVKENGVEVKKFGWHVSAMDPMYKTFLTQLMAELLPFLQSHGLTKENTYFHVSDEPNAKQIGDYKNASELLNSLIDGYPVIDAISEVEYFRDGLIRRPIPITNQFKKFDLEPLEQRWVYYCGNWQNGVPNRQFGMPSARNRILGMLLYLYRMDGFLNWGHNFWYTQFSLETDIDPYQITDAGRAFSGGGSFMVYPGKNGPVDSLHYEVYREGLQDQRALTLLEKLVGREAAEAVIYEDVPYRMTLEQYPRETQWLLQARDRINRAICAAMQ